MTLKERVKLLRRDNEILAQKIIELEETLEEMNGNMHYLINRAGWCTKDQLEYFKKDIYDKLEMCKEAINNQHRTLREEKADLDALYTKSLYALHRIVNNNPYRFRGTDVYAVLQALGVIPR